MALSTYSDLNFALKIGGDGNVLIEQDADAINQSIKAILSTTPGERVMEPEFGSAIPKIIYEPMDSMTAHLLRDETKKAIERWEDRVQVNYVTLDADVDNHLYVLTVSYRILKNGQTGFFEGKIRMENN